MLNLYLAPRSGKAPVPSDAAVDAVLGFLSEQAIIGEALGPDVYAPGAAVAGLFHDDATELLLPAELTFESLSVNRGGKPRLLPRVAPADGFADATCTVCDEPIDADALADALEELVYRPIERFSLTCASCRSELSLRQLDFGQPTAIARFWLCIEGAAFGRLTGAVIEQVEKRLGMPLVVVPEVPPEDVDEWAPARRSRPSRR